MPFLVHCVDASENSVGGDVRFAIVPKLVLKAINSPGRLPPDFCPITVGTTPSFTSAGNRSTAAGSDPNSVAHLHGSLAPPTSPSDYGQLLNCCYVLGVCDNLTS